MRIGFPAFVAALALLSPAAGFAQQEQSSASGATAGAAGAPATQESGGRPPNQSRPRRPSIFDVIKTVAPPLIDAATKPRRPTPADPAVAPGASGLPAADPPPATPVAVTVAPAPPAEILPPAQDEVPPVTSSAVISPSTRPAEPVVAPPRPVAQSLPARSGPQPPIDESPPASAKDPTQPTAAPASAAQQEPTNPGAGKMAWLLLALLVLAAVAMIGLQRLHRIRKVARTRSLLTLDARLERAPSRSPLVVRAQLIPGPAHG